MHAQPQPRGGTAAVLLIHRCYALMFLFPRPRVKKIDRPLRSLAATSVWDCTFRDGFTGAARACTTTLAADVRQSPEVTRPRETSHPWYGF
jgi:hypothetical protein